MQRPERPADDPQGSRAQITRLDHALRFLDAPWLQGIECLGVVY